MTWSRRELTGLLDHVQKGIAAGKSSDDITKVTGVPRFEGYEGNPTGPLQLAYEEPTAKG